MTNEQSTPNRNSLDRDCPTHSDVKTMIEAHTYSRAQIDTMLSTRLADKANQVDLENIEARLSQVVSQMTALTDTTRQWQENERHAHQQEFKRRSEMYDLRFDNIQRENDSTRSTLQELSKTATRQDKRLDDAFERVHGLEENDAATRAANALAWETIQKLIKGDEASGIRGLEPRLDDIDDKLTWVESRRGIERGFVRVVTSRAFWYAIAATFGGSGALALLFELLS